MPTLAEVEAVVGDLFRMVEEFDQYCNTNTEKFTNGSGSHEAEFLSNLTPADGVPFNTQAIMVEAVERFRRGLDSQYDIARSLIDTGLRTWADFAQFPESSPEKILDRLYTYFIDNSYSVLTRAITFGTPAAGSPITGDGILNRLTVDENSKDIESGHLDSKVCRCIRDQGSGASKHEEVFEIRGEDRLRDRLIVDGSGLVKTIRAISARDSLSYIQNPSFERFSGTAATPTDITGWTGWTTQNLSDFVMSTSTYRDYPGAPSTDYSLQWTATTGSTSVEVNQDLKNQNVSIRANVPLYVQMAVYKNGTSANGAVTLDLGGAAQASVNLSAMNDNAWNIVRATTGTTAGGNSDNWYKNHKQTGALNVDIGANNVDVGQILRFDDVIIAPYTEFDGTWYALVGGATKHVRDDEYTWSDTATESIIQKWIARLYPGRYLPHDTSTNVTWADPT